MTTDQFLTLLAICAWPTVALIAGVAFVHGVRLLVDGLFAAASKVSHDATFDTTRKLQLASSVLQSTLPAMVHAIATPRPVHRTDKLAATCEHALITILQANGGFPGSRGDDTTRQLVREVRKMFDEVNRPTPEPPIVDRGGGGSEPIHVTARDLDFDIGDMGDLEDVEEGEVYGS